MAESIRLSGTGIPGSAGHNLIDPFEVKENGYPVGTFCERSNDSANSHANCNISMAMVDFLGEALWYIVEVREFYIRFPSCAAAPCSQIEGVPTEHWLVCSLGTARRVPGLVRGH
jgi:hypothetical protein